MKIPDRTGLGEWAQYHPEDSNPPIPQLVVSPKDYDVLYGPDGEVISVMYDREPIKFGFQSASKNRGQTGSQARNQTRNQITEMEA